ncbi:hypothetical protein D3C72_1585450 [compost metagenome]
MPARFAGPAVSAFDNGVQQPKLNIMVFTLVGCIAQDLIGLLQVFVGKHTGVIDAEHGFSGPDYILVIFSLYGSIHLSFQVVIVSSLFGKQFTLQEAVPEISIINRQVPVFQLLYIFGVLVFGSRNLNPGFLSENRRAQR